VGEYLTRKPMLVQSAVVSADDPPLRRWVRVEEPQPDEGRPRRFLVFAAPPDALPLPMRRIAAEWSSEELLVRRRVTPPNAPIIPGDQPPLRPNRVLVEVAPEERAQRRTVASAVASTVIVFHPHFSAKAPPRRRTLKAPP
jgi:hypothetical protein